MRRSVVAIIGVCCAALSACTFDATLMARDSGRTYKGELSGGAAGSGTMTVTIDGTTYSGPAARVASNDTFGFASAYGWNSHGGTSTALGTSYTAGDVTVKALLSSPDGRGLRCDLVGRYPTGGGICVDDDKHVYDVILVRG
jgi:hypothetical protein